MPQAPSNGYAWRGRRACLCIIDATADYERLARSSLSGYIYQAAYSFAAASAGTHSRGGALDTITLTDRGIRISRTIGFWASNRTRWQGFTPHAHWILFGCPHAHPSLRYQESELRAGRNGLAGRGRDNQWRPGKIRTYRQWKAAQGPSPIQKLLKRKPLKRLTVEGINNARKGGYLSRYTYYVQKYLRTAGFYKSPIDGRWGQVTQAALNNFRRSLGWPEKDCVGPIGISSLTLLKRAGKGGKPIRP
jgi:hypothetical protein